MFSSLCPDIYKNQIFIKNKNLSLTYEQAFKISNYWAEYFTKNVVGDTVALSMPNCLEAHIVLFAAMQTHNVILINPVLLQLSPDLIQRLNVTDIVLFDRISDPNVNQLILNRCDITLNKVEQTLSTKWHRLTLLSSGTTGEVTPVTLQPDEIVAYGSLLENYFAFSENDCLYNVLPYYHGFGLTRIFTVINSGSSYYIPDEPDYRNIIQDIVRYNCTWISLVPNMAKVMIKNDGQLPRTFRLATVSADICSDLLITSFNERFNLPVFSEYGCTEASIISSNTHLNNKIGSVGKVDNNKVKIINNEIYAIAEWMLEPTWINTGDTGLIDSDGYLFIQGRTKEIIKRQGKTIFPHELEKNLEQVPGITEAVVYCNNSDNKGDCIGLVYVGSISESDVRKYCSNMLPVEYRPKTITQLEKIPRVGPKVRRRELIKYVNKF